MTREPAGRQMPPDGSKSIITPEELSIPMNLENNRRVLCAMPHPDDMEILAGGTLLRLSQMGYEVHIATMTAGDKGSAVHTPEEISAIRLVEAEKGARAVGAKSYRCVGLKDLEISFNLETRSKVYALLRQIDPFMIFTTPPNDYMFDHEICSQLIRDAAFGASIPNIKTGGGEAPTSGVPYLYYSDSVEGVDLFGRPALVSCIVDISATIDQKAEALKCHDSQRAWLMKAHGMDNYIESMRSWSKKRGEEAGYAYGEAFCQHRGHPHPHDDHLAEILGARQYDSTRR